jgi:hypothetical protein
MENLKTSDAILGGSVLAGMAIGIYKRKSFGMITLLGLGFGIGATVFNQILNIK